MMIKCCFVIELSRRFISLLYGREGEKHELKPIEDGQTRYALDTCLQNGGDIVAIVQRKLADFLRSYEVSLDYVKQSLPLGLMFADDVKNNVRDSVVDILSNDGFSNVRVIDKNALLVQSVLNHPTALILTSDGEDLYCHLYDVRKHVTIAFTCFSKAGRDPRVQVLAKDIWEQVSSRASYLEKENCMPIIRDEVEEFLASELRDKEGSVDLEKERFTYYIKKSPEVISLGGTGDKDILRSLVEFIQTQRVVKEDCALIMGKGLAGNPYFRGMLSGVFAVMSELDEAWEDALRQRIYEEMMSCVSLCNNVAPIADAIPQKNIGFTLGETTIAFNITFPENAFAIKIQRDGNILRTITSSFFTDTNLEPDHSYIYSFTTIFKDTTGRKYESRELNLTLTTAPVNLPSPVDLQVEEQLNKVRLSWESPKRGEVKVFWSPVPFDKHCNDIFDASQFVYPSLSSLDNVCVIEKNFSGERFYLPVVVVKGQGIAGEQKVISSMVPPTGVRVENGTAGSVKVMWLWDSVDAVRVSWYTNGENEGWKDVKRSEGNLPEFSFVPSAKARDVEIVVRSIYMTHDGTLLESIPVKQGFCIKDVNVSFIQAKSEATLFGNKNKYSITVSTDSVLPCDLYLMLEEGKMPINLENFTSQLTVSKDDLQIGVEKKYEFNYKRQNKHENLYLRLVVADMNFRKRVMINPEIKIIK